VHASRANLAVPMHCVLVFFTICVYQSDLCHLAVYVVYFNTRTLSESIQSDIYSI